MTSNCLYEAQPLITVNPPHAANSATNIVTIPLLYSAVALVLFMGDILFKSIS